jgi:outer membrane protein TolC
MKRLVIVIAASVSAASCVLGPNYRRPAVAVPAVFHDTTATTAQAESRSLTDLNRFDLFQDDTLTELVRVALAQNFDLRIAAERVLQARERFGIARADRVPVVVGIAGASENRVS